MVQSLPHRSVFVYGFTAFLLLIRVWSASATTTTTTTTAATHDTRVVLTNLTYPSFHPRAEPPAGYKFVDGDILVPEDVVADNMEAGTAAGQFGKWPKRADGKYEVVYDTSRIQGTRLYDQLQWCIRYLERGSNLAFREVQSGDTYYHTIKTDEDGCFASCGRMPARDGWGNLIAVLNLGPRCNSYHTILHEMLHTVGFMHEQKRVDSELTLDTSQLDDGWKSQVDPDGTLRKLTTYDAASVMHYTKIMSSRWGTTVTVMRHPDPLVDKYLTYYRTFLSSCDWDALNNQLYPGERKGPKCKPNKVAKILQPTEQFKRESMEAEWMCQYASDFFYGRLDSPNKCELPNGLEFPPLKSEFMTDTSVDDADESSADTASTDADEPSSEDDDDDDASDDNGAGDDDSDKDDDDDDDTSKGGSKDDGPYPPSRSRCKQLATSKRVVSKRGCYAACRKGVCEDSKSSKTLGKCLQKKSSKCRPIVMARNFAVPSSNVPGLAALLVAILASRTVHFS